MTPAERDAAILRGAARALERDPAAGGTGLIGALAHELILEDPRWTPLVLLPDPDEAPDPDGEQLEAYAERTLAALPPREWQALAGAARVLRDAEPGVRGTEARELATRLLAVASPRAWRAGGRAAPATARPAGGPGGVARLGCIACSTIAAVSILGFGVLAALLSDRPETRVIHPPRSSWGSPSARRQPPNGRRNVAQLDAAPKAPAPVPRNRVEREAAAIGVLRAIGAAQVLARDLDGAKDESFRFQGLAGLIALHRLAPAFGDGHRQGYVFATAPSGESAGERFWATASPESPEPGSRWFFTNETGVVLAATAPFVLDGEACQPTAPAPPPAVATGRADPDRARAFAATGLEALYAGRWFDAVAPLETSLELAPTNLEAWANLGKAYLELGVSDRWTREGQLPENALLARAEGALAHGTAGTGGGPGHSSERSLCHNNLGRLFLERSQDVGRLPADKPARTEARLALLRRAAASFGEALALDPDLDVARINASAAWLGEAELVPPEERARSGERALQALEGCRARERTGDPNASAAFRNLGLAHAAAGHPREAVRALAAVLDAGAGAADARCAAVLREQALLVARSLAKPTPDDDAALLKHAAELLHARGRSGVRGSGGDEAAALEIERALSGD